MSFDSNEVTFFIESSINTLATLSVFSNASVSEICGQIDQEYELAQMRQAMGLAAQLEAAGIDPIDGIVLPWEETSGFRRRLMSSASSASQQPRRQGQRLQGPSLASPAAGGRWQAARGQPAVANGCQQPCQGVQQPGLRQQARRLLAGDMGDRVTDPLNVLAAARTDPNNPSDVHVLPRAKLFKCTGPFLSSGCPNGKVPAISANALHQVHIWCAARAGRP
jgi:hypothetical protein